MSVRTESERLFELYCQKRGIEISRIPEDQEKETPDYQLAAFCPSLIVEVKQLDLNPNEKVMARQLVERGWTDAHDAYGSKPGVRTGEKIKRAAGQLHSYAEVGHPTMVVLFDNRGKPWIDPGEILNGMYGLHQFKIAVPKTSNETPGIVDRGFGRNRTLTATTNTSVSAVAALHYWGDNDIQLNVYHNVYGRNPIDPESIASICDRQFRLSDKMSGEFQEWERIDSIP